MFCASSFSKITTMTWSGVGNPASVVDADGRAVRPGSASAEQAVRATSARVAAAAVLQALTPRVCAPRRGKHGLTRAVVPGVSSNPSAPEVDVVVIGAGQAGLSTAWALARQGFEPETEFVVLDGDAAPGGAWQ